MNERQNFCKNSISSLTSIRIYSSEVCLPEEVRITSCGIHLRKTAVPLSPGTLLVGAGSERTVCYEPEKSSHVTLTTYLALLAASLGTLLISATLLVSVTRNSQLNRVFMHSAPGSFSIFRVA